MGQHGETGLRITDFRFSQVVDTEPCHCVAEGSRVKLDAIQPPATQSQGSVQEIELPNQPIFRSLSI